MSAQHDTHTAPTFGSDTKAAFLGFFIGALVLLGIVTTIVRLTNAKYSHEKPAAGETK